MGHAVARKVDQDRFMFARGGDHWVTRFQCDLCHFRNIQGRDPREESGIDSLLLRCIRRANLDAMWSREASTIRGLHGELLRMSRKAKTLGINPRRFYPAMGPLPVEDKDGMGVACCVLMRSLDGGKNESTVQFKTASFSRTAYGNMWHASAHGGLNAVVVRDTAKMFHTSCPTFGDWYERFTLGMHKRMGDLTIQDEAMSVELLLAVLELFERDFGLAGDDLELQADVIFPAAFCVVGFCAGLRGEEIPLMDLCETAKLFDVGMNHADPDLRHVIVPLIGRFKTETGEKTHLMPLVPVTTSGIPVARWVKRVLDWYHTMGITRGPVFRDKDNEPVRASDYDFDICTRIAEVQANRPGLVQPEVDVFDRYSMRRSLRRGSDSQAIAQGVDAVDIELNNRWRLQEQAKGRKPKMRMIQHYADVRILLPALLRYSRAL